MGGPGQEVLLPMNWEEALLGCGSWCFRCAYEGVL